MSDNYKKSLRPKEPHPMVPFVQQIFVAAGPEYVNHVMDHLQTLIEKEKDTTPIEENNAGVLYETFRKVVEGEGLNDRYLMGAALYLVGSLIPVATVIKSRVEALNAEDTNEDTAP